MMEDLAEKLRLLLDEPETVQTSKDMGAALDMWRMINAQPNKWARLEADEHQIVVIWGYREGMKKDRQIQTVKFGLDNKGEVIIIRYTHS